MNDHPSVILYGDSLIIDSVQTCLAENPDILLIRLYGTEKNIVRQMTSINPQLIIFDIYMLNFEHIFLFLRTHPDTPALGVDADSNLALILGSQRQAVQTKEELAALIRAITATKFNAELAAHLPGNRLDPLPQ